MDWRQPVVTKSLVDSAARPGGRPRRRGGAGSSYVLRPAAEEFEIGLIRS